MKPGTYLRLRREAAAVSVEDIESLCDVPTGNLVAIEAGTMFATQRQLADMQLLFAFNPSILRGLDKGLPMQVCRGCACSTYDACPGGCHWAEPDLCSTCSINGKGSVK